MQLDKKYLHDLALTNHIIAAARSVDDVEAYSKWWYGGAYNGAVVCNDSRVFSLTFHREPSPKLSHDPSQRASFSSGFIDFTNISRQSITAVVRTSEDFFQSLGASTPPGLLNRVQRLQAWLLYAESASHAPDVIRGLIGTTLTANHRSLPPSPAVPEGCQVDIEFLLPEPIPEADLLQVLASCLPGVGTASSSLFGFGLPCAAHTGVLLPEGIRYLHLTARQF